VFVVWASALGLLGAALWRLQTALNAITPKGRGPW